MDKSQIDSVVSNDHDHGIVTWHLGRFAQCNLATPAKSRNIPAVVLQERNTILTAPLPQLHLGMPSLHPAKHAREARIGCRDTKKGTYRT